MGIRYLKILLSVILLALNISTSKSTPTLLFDDARYTTSVNYNMDICGTAQSSTSAETITEEIAFGKHPLTRPSSVLKTQVPFRKVTDVSLFFKSIAKHICSLENMLTDNRAKIFSPDIKYIPQPTNRYYIYTLRQIII